MIEALLAVLGMIGATASAYVASKLFEVYRITGDHSYKVAAFAFGFFSLGLIIEGLDLLMPSHGPRCLNCPWKELFESFAKYKYSFLAQSIYLVSYSLYFAASLTSSQAYAIAPFIFLLLGEQSLLTVFLLTFNFFIAFDNKNWRFLTFYSMLIASHAILAMYAFGNGGPLVEVSYLLRSLAPITLVCLSRCGA